MMADMPAAMGEAELDANDENRPPGSTVGDGKQTVDSGSSDAAAARATGRSTRSVKRRKL
jgi:hypothetical protein